MKYISRRILLIFFKKIYVRYIFVFSYVYTYFSDSRLLEFYNMLRFGNAIGVRSQPWRGYDILRVLKKYKPKQIAEMGSGTSSAVFASNLSRNDGHLVTYEQSSEWHKTTMNALNKTGLKNDKINIELVPSEESEKGSRFTKKIGMNSDFIYIDGPVTVKVNGQKMPCLDIIEFLDDGNCPDVIMIDGRYDTVKAIMTHPASEKYDVTLEYGLASKERNLREILRFRRHTIFTKKN